MSRSPLSRRTLGLAGVGAGIAAALPGTGEPVAAKCRKKKVTVQPEITHAVCGTVRIQYGDIPACVVRLESIAGGPVTFGEDNVPTPVPETSLIPGPARGSATGLMYQITGIADPAAGGIGAAGEATQSSWSIYVTGGEQDAATGAIQLDGQIVAGELGTGEVILSISSVIAFIPELIPPLPPLPESVASTAP